MDPAAELRKLPKIDRLLDTERASQWLSRDGRALLFVRSGPTAPNATARGALYLVRLGRRPVGPLADLGTTTNYYGNYGWSIDWFQPLPP